MSEGQYIFLTVLMYGLQTVGAMVASNITDIFGFVAAFSISFLNFTMPGMFYLAAHKKFATLLQKKNKQAVRNSKMAMVYVVAGGVIFAVQLIPLLMSS